MIEPFYEDKLISVYSGDALSVLRQLPSECVHCVVTSPPYFGLRDYKTEPLIWGGSAGCEHEWQEYVKPHPNSSGGEKQLTNSGSFEYTDRTIRSFFCERCGAWRGSLGLEPLHDCLAWARGEPPCSVCYVCHIRAIAAEIHRVLRGEGTFWLNLGDSYSGSGCGANDSRPDGSSQSKYGGKYVGQKPGGAPGLKHKDMYGVPWRVALALQSDGWWLRQDCIWAKGISFVPTYSGSAMPESVKDRFCRAHEYVFLLTKSSRYFFDLEAVKEESVTKDTRKGSDGAWAIDGRNKWEDGAGKPQNRDVTKRTPRSVWAINPQPYRGHFAVFPERLVEVCILAGTSEGNVVLDPFAGSGTTLAVAERLGRKAIGIELNRDSCALIVERCKQRALISLGGSYEASNQAQSVSSS